MNLEKGEKNIMAIVRWSDPLREFVFFQNRVNRAFSESKSGDDLLTSGVWAPPVDIYQTDRELVLKAELPDLTRDSIEVTVENGTLTIRGEKKASSDVPEESFHRIERRYGTFSRSFSLPQTFDTDKVGAEYKNGVLTVRLPLREEAKPRQIRVDVAA
jgi:HSP20 family protein